MIPVRLYHPRDMLTISLAGLGATQRKEGMSMAVYVFVIVVMDAFNALHFVLFAFWLT